MTKDGANTQEFAVASVGSAADAAKSGQYVKSTNDVVIGSLRTLIPATLVANTAVSTLPGDPLGHGFVPIYLNPAHEAYAPVVAMLQSLLDQLQTKGCPAK
jgi:hypothetical protein